MLDKVNDISRISCMETKCTGCGACVNVCPRGAIELKERNGYFLFPEIDAAKCNQCGLCLKKCPAAAPRPAPSKITNEVAYGCYVKDEMERARSSSGGFFQALAKYVLRQGGAVCGAAFTHGCHLEHVIITDEKDLPPLQRSKYLQSNPGFVYSRIKKLLYAGKNVLFVGTPCQVAALKAVVGESNNNLITVDLLCHGVPPNKLFKEYVDCLTGGQSNKVTNIIFRDKKSEGWNRFHVCFDWPDGNHYDKYAGDDLYFKAFAENLTLRRSCGDCRYARMPRIGDFTIGDLWEVAEKELMITDNKGTSVVILNSQKAFRVFDEIRTGFNKVKKVEIETVARWNLLQSHSYLHPNATRFWQSMYGRDCSKSIGELIVEALNKDDGVLILNYHDAHTNYGSVLAGYALQEKIKSMLGFSPVSIHFWPVERGDPELGDIISFNREKIIATELIHSEWQLKKMCRYFRTYIVGPDIVWRNCGFTGNFYWHLFNFVPFSRNICSYAASFQYDYLCNMTMRDLLPRELSRADILERKRLMKRFAHISVREDSGVAICHKNFDVQAEHVLDSVFLLTADDYNKLILNNASDLCEDMKGRRVNYVLNPSSCDAKILAKINEDPLSASLCEGMDYDKMYKGEDFTCKGVTVRQWVSAIRDCESLATNSFHGICFALIFRKQFVFLPPSNLASTERIDSLFRMLGIPHDRYAYTVEDYERILATPLDYSKIEPRLNEWIAKSEEYLKRVLADNKPNRMRDWLESVEMLVEASRYVPPPPQTLGRRILRIPRAVLRRMRNWGIISDKSDGDSRKLGIFGLPVFTILRAQGRKRLKLWGLPILSVKR